MCEFCVCLCCLFECANERYVKHIHLSNEDLRHYPCVNIVCGIDTCCGIYFCACQVDLCTSTTSTIFTLQMFSACFCVFVCVCREVCWGCGVRSIILSSLQHLQHLYPFICSVSSSSSFIHCVCGLCNNSFFSSYFLDFFSFVFCCCCLLGVGWVGWVVQFVSHYTS